MTAEHFFTTTVPSVYICIDRVCKQEARSRSSLKMFRYDDLCQIRIPSFNEGFCFFLSFSPSKLVRVDSHERFEFLHLARPGYFR